MAPTFDIPLGSSKTSAKRTSPAIRMEKGKHPPLQVSQEFQIHVIKNSWLFCFVFLLFRRLSQHDDMWVKVVMMMMMMMVMTIMVVVVVMVIKIMTLAHPVS